MEKIRKIFIPILCAVLAVAGSVSYFRKTDVQIISTKSSEIQENYSNLSSNQEIIQEEKEQTQGDTRVNLNTATAEELQIAPGIGPSKAEAIIKYRNEYGSFSSVDELIEISGIGEKTLAKIRDYYVVK